MYIRNIFHCLCSLLLIFLLVVSTYTQSLWQNLLWDMAFMLSHNVIIINVYMAPFKGNCMLDISLLRFFFRTKPNCTASPKIDRPLSQLIVLSFWKQICIFYWLLPLTYWYIFFFFFTLIIVYISYFPGNRFYLTIS